MRGESDLIAVHAADEAAIDGGAAGAPQCVVGQEGKGEGATGVLDVDEELVGGVFDGVGLADVGLAAVENDGVWAEVEQEHAGAVLADHAEARLGRAGSDGVGEAGKHAHDAGVAGWLRGRGCRFRTGWRGKGADGAALDFGSVVGDGGRGGADAAAASADRWLAVDVERGGDGVIADDDFAFDVNEAGAGEAAVRTHGEDEGAGLILNDDTE